MKRIRIVVAAVVLAGCGSKVDDDAGGESTESDLASEADGFEPCVENGECMDGGMQGVCEQVGACSFPDESCASGARFSEDAPADLAGHCVPEPAGTDT